MKLLSPSVTKDIQGQEMSRDILRAQELAELLKESRIKLEKSEEDYRLILERQRQSWEAFELSHHDRKKELQKEIEELEEKKLNLLIPFGILKEGSDDRFKEAETFLSSLRERENRVEDLTDRLEDKLDEVGERESEVKREEHRLELVDEGLQRQVENIKLQSERLTNEIANFSAKKFTEEKEIGERKTSIFLNERTLLAKEESLKRTEKALSDLRTQLQDERRVLDDAWKELERKRSQKNQK